MKAIILLSILVAALLLGCIEPPPPVEPPVPPEEPVSEPVTLGEGEQEINESEIPSEDDALGQELDELAAELE